MKTYESIALHDALSKGDLEGLKTVLGNPPDFPNCTGPAGVGETILEYAIYHSPLPLIRALLEAGADPNYADAAGFPSLLAALSCQERGDRCAILELLLAWGANVQQRGLNDYTPLHLAAVLEDVAAMELLIAHGADPDARTRIDDCATPLEEAEILGRGRAIAFLQKLDAS